MILSPIVCCLGTDPDPDPAAVREGWLMDSYNPWLPFFVSFFVLEAEVTEEEEEEEVEGAEDDVEVGVEVEVEVEVEFEAPNFHQNPWVSKAAEQWPTKVKWISDSSADAS